MRIPSILLILSFCSSAIAASITPNEEASARETALQWLQLVDSGDYDHAVGQTAEQMGVQQHWQNYLTARRAPLGRVKNRQIVEVKHKPNVRGAQVWWKYCAIRLKTSFERPPSSSHGVASNRVTMEEVVLTKMSCCWEVSGYTIFESEPDRHSGKWNETREHAGQFSEPEATRHD